MVETWCAGSRCSRCAQACVCVRPLQLTDSSITIAALLSELESDNEDGLEALTLSRGRGLFECTLNRSTLVFLLQVIPRTRAFSDAADASHSRSRLVAPTPPALRLLVLLRIVTKPA